MTLSPNGRRSNVARVDDHFTCMNVARSCFRAREHACGVIRLGPACGGCGFAQYVYAIMSPRNADRNISVSISANINTMRSISIRIRISLVIGVRISIHMGISISARTGVSISASLSSVKGER
jgi:hypothetical protein